jgi:hypothetical protein
MSDTAVQYDLSSILKLNMKLSMIGSKHPIRSWLDAPLASY